MYLSGKEYHVQEKDRKYLLELFSRGGSCKGYYDMYRGPEMMAFANEKKSGTGLYSFDDEIPVCVYPDLSIKISELL